MKTLRVLLVTLMLTSAGMARAGMYAKFAGLYSSPGDIQVNNAAAFRASLKSNMGMAIALGYKISAVRADIEIQSFSNSTSSGSTNTGNASTTGGYKQFNGFVNAYVDLPSFVGLSGYVGAGFGEARVDLAVESFSAAPLAAPVSATVTVPDAPTGVTATPVTPPEWPFSVCNSRPVPRSHTFSVLSDDAETARFPSGVTATPRTE